MTYKQRVVLYCPEGYQQALDPLVNELLQDGVELIAIAGKDSATVEDIVDELIVGDGSDTTRFANTTSHRTIEEAIEFAKIWPAHGVEDIQIIEL